MDLGSVDGCFFVSSRRRHTRWTGDWSSDVCSSDLVAVVSGAGVNAVGVHPTGKVARFLSLGDITGDWGGGYAVGVAGLGAAVRAEDGRGPATTLSRRVAEHFSVADAEAVALGVHRGTITHASLHGLAPLVFEAASVGDQ